jgi:hypothetical protein
VGAIPAKVSGGRAALLQDFPYWDRLISPDWTHYE